MDPASRPISVAVDDTEKSTPSRSTVSLSIETKDTPELPSASTAEPEFPEGGFWGWCTVIGAWLLQFSGFGYVNAFGAFQDFYVRQYLTNSTPSQIGWIGGIQICLTFSMGVFTGRLFDRGYFYWLNAASFLLYAIAVFTLSVSHPNQYYQVFLSHGVVLGLASGLSYTPSLSIVGHYFRRKRPLVVGIVTTGSALGAVLHPIILNQLFSNGIGFHNGIRISGALNVFLLIVANGLMRTRLPPHLGGSALPLIQFLSDPPYLVALLSGMLVFFGLFFSVFYLQLYAVLHGVDETFAFYSLSILNAASIAGRIFPGCIAPKLGPLNLTIFFTLATGVVTACMAAVRDRTGVVIYAIFFGFVSGGSIALAPAMMVSLIDNQKEYGARLGIFFFFGGLIGLVATPISGALLTRDYHWIRATMFAGAFLFVSGIGFLIARMMVAKKKGNQIL